MPISNLGERHIEQLDQLIQAIEDLDEDLDEALDAQCGRAGCAGARHILHQAATALGLRPVHTPGETNQDYRDIKNAEDGHRE